MSVRLLPGLCTATKKKLRRTLAEIGIGRKPQRVHHWSIGIFMGTSPTHLGPSAAVVNPVLTRREITDAHANFVADPFMIRVYGLWHMFFEVSNRKSSKGEVGLATSKNGLTWSYDRIVLAEPFHLSYPYVFEWQGAYYLIPESQQAKAVRLYRAEAFPTRWRFIKNLLEGLDFNDPSVFFYRDKWWLFVETAPSIQCDTLRLYCADDIEGPWLEHPKSPIIDGDPHVARPAGRVVVLGDRIIRYAQDCYPIYGTNVRAFEITRLTPTEFEEHPVSSKPILAANGNGWNSDGMHHVDPHRLEDGQWMACTDGFSWR